MSTRLGSAFTGPNHEGQQAQQLGSLSLIQGGHEAVSHFMGSRYQLPENQLAAGSEPEGLAPTVAGVAFTPNQAARREACDHVCHSRPIQRDAPTESPLIDLGFA